MALLNICPPPLGMFLAISLRPALFASQDKVDESTAAMQLYNTLHNLNFDDPLLR